MSYTSKLGWAAALAFVAAGVLSGGSANATVLDLGTGPTLNVIGMPQDFTITISATDTKTLEVNKFGASQVTTDYFPNQNHDTIASGIQGLFGLATVPTTPTYVSGGVDSNFGPGTFTGASPFNFVAIYNDSGEVVLYYATPVELITLDFAGQLSNVRLYSVGGAVPEPATWALMALGFAGLGFAGYRKSRPAISIA